MRITLEEFRKHALERVEDWGYSGPLDLSYWGRTGFHTDRDARGEAQRNWERASQALLRRFPDAFQVVRSRSSLCGWVEELFVDTRAEKACKEVVRMINRRLAYQEAK
jgi:hypothetical protein